MKPWIVAAIPCVLSSAMLVGCGEAVPRGDTIANANAEAPDPMEAKIANLSEPLQRVTFFRAIQDAGYACQHIESVRSRGRIDGRAFWTVACDDGSQYGIVLQRGGVFQVTGAPKRSR